MNTNEIFAVIKSKFFAGNSVKWNEVLEAMGDRTDRHETEVVGNAMADAAYISGDHALSEAIIESLLMHLVSRNAGECICELQNNASFHASEFGFDRLRLSAVSFACPRSPASYRNEPADRREVVEAKMYAQYGKLCPVRTAFIGRRLTALAEGRKQGLEDMSIEETTEHFRKLGFNYHRVTGFWGGLGNVETMHGWHFHIHPDGTPAYKERYVKANIFEESVGLASVSDGKDWFHIKADGTPAYEARYKEVYAWHEGLAIVVEHPSNGQRKGKCFHIRPDGTPAYAERYDGASSFEGGVAWVETHRPSYQRFQIRPDGSRV